ncbi:CueP family metal-binding protein [Microbacterium resistens]|uniref:CueP family metal-binding protein n=1 Tax=Microbacterium resistens TaxID=156977 RepID=UPI00082A9425|nr:CueP family metal-binding protein [Microbacterium resistens]
MSHRTTMPRRRLFAAAAAVLVSGLALTGCAAPAPTAAPSAASSETSDSEFLAEHNLDGLGAAQIIERLDTLPVADRPTNLIASVRPDVLVLTDGQGRETQVAMPEDEVYISVAPFRAQTHYCYFHSLTTCLGELANTEVQVTLTDEATGDVLINDLRQTFDNGFVGFWVPRGLEATLTIGLNSQTGTATISTVNADDPTCITTLQLT